MTATDGEKDCGVLKASSILAVRRARARSDLFPRNRLVSTSCGTDLYNQRVSLSPPAKRIMLSVPARKIDQKYTALADLCGKLAL